MADIYLTKQIDSSAPELAGGPLKIEITQEMIEAGAEVLISLRAGLYCEAREVAEDVLLAALRSEIV